MIDGKSLFLQIGIDYFGMNSIRVKNFKSVFDSKTFELRPLTVLAGVNSSGNSVLKDLANKVSDIQNNINEDVNK